MLISTEKVKGMDDFKNIDYETLERKLKAIEIAIRSHTHNNFQNRFIRVKGSSSTEFINAVNKNFKVGDTVEISQSINNGLYTINKIEDGKIYLKEPIYSSEENVVTKIEYPEDVIEGALDILKWDLKMKDKLGISSETISRHSVTYQNLDTSNTIKGRPASLFGFCTPYIKVRF